MSLISATLAFLVSAIGAKRPKIERDPVDVDIIVAQQTEIDDLRRQLREARLLVDTTRPIRRAQVDAEMYQRLARFQAQQMQAENGIMLGQTVFGAHNLGQQIDDFVCNCVPARHDMFLRE